MNQTLSYNMFFWLCWTDSQGVQHKDVMLTNTFPSESLAWEHYYKLIEAGQYPEYLRVWIDPPEDSIASSGLYTVPPPKLHNYPSYLDLYE